MKHIKSFPRWGVWLFILVSGAGIILSAASDGGSPEGAHPTRKRVALHAGEALDGGALSPEAPTREIAPNNRVAMSLSASEFEHVELERLMPATSEAQGASSNVFGATSWAPPPPPPAPAPVVQVLVPADPPKPTAPPMPFNYLGLYQEGTLRSAILSKGDHVYTVSPGDVIEGVYRVEDFKEKEIELTYIPMNIRQTLSTGGA